MNESMSAVYLEILSDFTNKPLERQLPDQELGTLLVLANFTKQQGKDKNYNLQQVGICRQKIIAYRRATVPGR